MWRWMYDSGWWWWGSLIMMLFWVFVIWALVGVSRRWRDEATAPGAR